MSWQFSLSRHLAVVLLILLSQYDVINVVQGETLTYTIDKQCRNYQMDKILRSKVKCKLEDHLIDLTKHVWNMTIPTEDVIDILPSVVSVKRCGGNCARTSHRCIPSQTRNRSIPVMMVMALHPHGVHETHCAHVEVEEHVGCDCNCPIKPEDCGNDTSVKTFDSRQCRCKCVDDHARRQCLHRDMEWNETSCSCMCPPRKWKPCSTGYMFDFGPRCHCTPVNMNASLGLIAALVVLIICLVIMVVGGVLMYRRRSGPFVMKTRSMSRQQLHDRKNSLLKTLDGSQKRLKGVDVQ